MDEVNIEKLKDLLVDYDAGNEEEKRLVTALQQCRDDNEKVYWALREEVEKKAYGTIFLIGDRVIYTDGGHLTIKKVGVRA